MTRTTDDLQDAEKFQPLGPPIRKPEPPKPWRRVAPGVLEDEDGHLHTDIPMPKETS